MKITDIVTKPLRIPYKAPFHWAQGVVDAAEVTLVCVHTDEGIIGYGESMASASASAVELLLQQAALGGSALLVCRHVVVLRTGLDGSRKPPQCTKRRCTWCG